MHPAPPAYNQGQYDRLEPLQAHEVAHIYYVDHANKRTTLKAPSVKMGQETVTEYYERTHCRKWLLHSLEAWAHEGTLLDRCRTALNKGVSRDPTKRAAPTVLLS